MTDEAGDHEDEEPCGWCGDLCPIDDLDNVDGELVCYDCLPYEDEDD